MKNKITIPLFTLFLLALLFLHPATTDGQITFSKGAVLPPSPLENDLFWNLETQRVWGFRNGEWKDEFLAPVQDVQWCHSRLIFTEGNRQFILYINAAGKQDYMTTLKVICHEGLSVDSSAIFQRFVDTTGKCIGFISEKLCSYSNIQHLNAESGYSVPKAMRDDGIAVRECNELKTWGFLTVKGHWLIEPKFDGPFSFQNGFADVVYYGQKRKINEQGEFVE